MSRQTLTIGGIDEAATHLLENLPLPVLEDIGAVSWIADALAQAAKERRGVVCLGPKGAGKTIALDLAVERFKEGEREIQQRSAKYRRRRVLHLRTLRGEKPRDVVVTIAKAITGRAPALKVRGRTKTPDELFEELVTHLRNQRVAVIVIDEAETLSDAALSILRDILSLAESTSKARYTKAGTVPAGVGVLLVGTWELHPRMMSDLEAGERWARVQTIGQAAAEAVPQIYRRLFPAFERFAALIGDAAWEHFILGHVSQGHELSLRLIENHTRAYARRMVNLDPEVRSVEAIPFNEEVFLFTLAEVTWAMRREENDAAA
jgi:hypothetical protein